jgi:hypothetical protein
MDSGRGKTRGFVLIRRKASSVGHGRPTRMGALRRSSSHAHAAACRGAGRHGGWRRTVRGRSARRSVERVGERRAPTKRSGRCGRGRDRRLPERARQDPANFSQTRRAELAEFPSRPHVPAGYRFWISSFRKAAEEAFSFSVPGGLRASASQSGGASNALATHCAPLARPSPRNFGPQR